MCRLFGLSGGSDPVHATFWLLEAPDSLAQQSRREPDGTGLGAYPDGCAFVSKRPIAAYEDQDFACEAKTVCSRTFVAHVRYASTGGLAPQNTHPFNQRDRLFAHNGVIEGLPQLERELGDEMALVRGDTDSERFFALITREAERTGDIGAGIAAAARWVAAHLPVYALNVILIDDGDLWALRYPDTHELYVLQRSPGGDDGDSALDHCSDHKRIKVESDELSQCASVVIASERMDDDPGWRLLRSGELLHVDAELNVSTSIALTRPPAHPLTLADLDPRAQSSQQPLRH